MTDSSTEAAPLSVAAVIMAHQPSYIVADVGCTCEARLEPRCTVEGYAEHVADELEKAGFGVLPSAEFKPERIYYRALYDGGKIWVEARSDEEVVRMSRGRDVVFEKLEVREYTKGWEPWTPSF